MRLFGAFSVMGFNEPTASLSFWRFFSVFYCTKTCLHSDNVLVCNFGKTIFSQKVNLIRFFYRQASMHPFLEGFLIKKEATIKEWKKLINFPFYSPPTLLVNNNLNWGHKNLITSTHVKILKKLHYMWTWPIFLQLQLRPSE